MFKNYLEIEFVIINAISNDRERGKKDPQRSRWPVRNFALISGNMESSVAEWKSTNRIVISGILNYSNECNDVTRSRILSAPQHRRNFFPRLYSGSSFLFFLFFFFCPLINRCQPFEILSRLLYVNFFRSNHRVSRMFSRMQGIHVNIFSGASLEVFHSEDRNGQRRKISILFVKL